MTVLQDIYNIDELCIFGFEWHQDNFDELQLLSGEESNSFSILSSSSLEGYPSLLSSWYLLWKILSFLPPDSRRSLMNSPLGTLETRRDGCFRRLFLCALCRRRQSGRVVRALDLQFGCQSPEFKSHSWALAGFVHGSPEFRSSATLENSQFEFLTQLSLI